MDSVQRLLVIVVIVLTVLLVIVGIQVVFIILDLRRAVKRLNSILEDAILGGGLIRPDKLTGIMEILKKNNWNRLASAAELGIHKTTLFRKIKKLNITLPHQDGRNKNGHN